MNDIRSPRPQHRPSRRDEIVQAAVHVFARKGCESPMGTVAAEAGVAESGVYYHFPNKAELFGSAIAHVFTSAGGALDSSSDEGRRDHVIDALCRWVTSRPHEAVLLREHFHSTDVQISQLRRQFERQVVRRLSVHGTIDLAKDHVSATSHVLAARTLILAVIDMYAISTDSPDHPQDPDANRRAAAFELAHRLGLA